MKKELYCEELGITCYSRDLAEAQKQLEQKDKEINTLKKKCSTEQINSAYAETIERQAAEISKDKATINDLRQRLKRCAVADGQNERLVMPLQPINDGRFIPNRIVEKLLEIASIDMNDIAVMDFNDQERMQFAQLIGYSLGGFNELSYVDDETYDAAVALFKIHSDDLEI